MLMGKGTYDHYLLKFYIKLTSLQDLWPFGAINKRWPGLKPTSKTESGSKPRRPTQIKLRFIPEKKHPNTLFRSAFTSAVFHNDFLNRIHIYCSASACLKT